MDYNQIYNTQYIDIACELLARLVDVTGIESPCAIDDNQATDYEKIVVDSSITKPSEQEFLDELERWKIENLQSFASSLSIDVTGLTSSGSLYYKIQDEVKRQIIDKLNSYGDDLFNTLRNIGHYRANIKSFINVDIHKMSYDEITALLQSIEAEYPNVKSAREAREAREARMRQGKFVRTLCSNIMDTIIGFNMESGRTSEEINSLKATFADIFALLKDYQPFQAKPLIEAITVDEVITQQMKDEILEHYNASI